MRKWSSNSNKILEQIPAEEREIKANEIQIDDSIKTLGIGWLPIADYFFFSVPRFDHNEQLTKRNFLSQVAKLFDPQSLNQKSCFKSYGNKLSNGMTKYRRI